MLKYYAGYNAELGKVLAQSAIGRQALQATYDAELMPGEALQVMSGSANQRNLDEGEPAIRRKVPNKKIALNVLSIFVTREDYESPIGKAEPNKDAIEPAFYRTNDACTCTRTTDYELAVDNATDKLIWTSFSDCSSKKQRAAELKPISGYEPTDDACSYSPICRHFYCDEAYTNPPIISPKRDYYNCNTESYWFKSANVNQRFDINWSIQEWPENNWQRLFPGNWWQYGGNTCQFVGHSNGSCSQCDSQCNPPVPINFADNVGFPCIGIAIDIAVGTTGNAGCFNYRQDYSGRCNPKPIAPLRDLSFKLIKQKYTLYASLNGKTPIQLRIFAEDQYCEIFATLISKAKQLIAIRLTRFKKDGISKLAFIEIYDISSGEAELLASAKHGDDNSAIQALKEAADKDGNWQYNWSSSHADLPDISNPDEGTEAFIKQKDQSFQASIENLDNKANSHILPRAFVSFAAKQTIWLDLSKFASPDAVLKLEDANLASLNKLSDGETIIRQISLKKLEAFDKSIYSIIAISLAYL